MEQIRVLIGDMPRLLREIVREILARTPGTEVIAELAEDDALLAAARESGADVVVVGVERMQLPQLCAPLFVACPTIKVLAITRDGENACLAINHPSPQGLRDAICVDSGSPSPSASGDASSQSTLGTA